uniref:Nuclear factor of activated T cells 4 n=1 Tax=Scleropages formosus TaxID=113540 RepID=A0A8C9VTP9_SCLFO
MGSVQHVTLRKINIPESNLMLGGCGGTAGLACACSPVGLAFDSCLGCSLMDWHPVLGAPVCPVSVFLCFLISKVSGSRVLECPSIQITTISPEEDSTPAEGAYWDSGGGWDRERLYLPLLDPFSYREGAGSLSPSPASSPSSRGWLSPASSCDSLLVEEDELAEATTHFCLTPTSRPTSPGGKRRRNSPLPSPSTSRRGSYSEEYPSPLDSVDPAPQSQALPGSLELSIPQKTRKTSLEQVSPRDVDPEQAQITTSPCPHPDVPQPRRETSTLAMDYLSVPSALGWGRSRASAHSPLFRPNALPPLDWPLPSQFDQYELRIEVQPRPHHRAHYETEGSRGAVKATPTGHPVIKLLGYTERQPLTLQVFVGTADDRSIRPHPFYQIHRVTGKMVGTASQESLQAGTKLLEIPLNPETDMTALIDCAGILKLRNSDIELRKGETDVGRKNTRVRLVFRTHVPLAPPLSTPSRILALQVASLPIECSQRSAQELPVVESLSLSSCSVEGGEELLLGGANFLPSSRVLFMERGTDGKLQWEEDAQVDRDKSSECLLCVTVPPYSDLCVSQPVSVCLYVSNGKRKRSSTQCFKYLPGSHISAAHHTLRSSVLLTSSDPSLIKVTMTSVELQVTYFTLPYFGLAVYFPLVSGLGQGCQLSTS